MTPAERKVAIDVILGDIKTHCADFSWRLVVVLNAALDEHVETHRATFEHYRMSVTRVRSTALDITATIASIHDTENDYLLMLGGEHGYSEVSETLWRSAATQARRN